MSSREFAGITSQSASLWTNQRDRLRTTRKQGRPISSAQSFAGSTRTAETEPGRASSRRAGDFTHTFVEQCFTGCSHQCETGRVVPPTVTAQRHTDDAIACSGQGQPIGNARHGDESSRMHGQPIRFGTESVAAFAEAWLTVPPMNSAGTPSKTASTSTTGTPRFCTCWPGSRTPDRPLRRPRLSAD